MARKPSFRLSQLTVQQSTGQPTMPHYLVATPQTTLRIPTEEVTFTYARSSGPGGQNVNKVSSKAVLRWNVKRSTALTDEQRARLLTKLASRLTTDGDLVISSDRYRDQPRNRDDCVQKLKTTIAAALRVPKTRKPTKPSRAAKQRRLASKQQHAAKKQSRRRIANHDD
jgi:ribosome-associated protein